MKKSPEGKKIENCDKCSSRAHKAGPMSFVCTAMADRQVRGLGFPTWCPLKDWAEQEVAEDVDMLERLKGVISPEEIAVLKEKLEANPQSENLPPRPWDAVKVGEDQGCALELLLDTNKDLIVICKHKHGKSIINLFKTAPKLLDACKAISKWHEYAGNKEQFESILADITHAILEAESE